MHTFAHSQRGYAPPPLTPLNSQLLPDERSTNTVSQCAYIAMPPQTSANTQASHTFTHTFTFTYRGAYTRAVRLQPCLRHYAQKLKSTPRLRQCGQVRSVGKDWNVHLAPRCNLPSGSDDAALCASLRPSCRSVHGLPETELLEFFSAYPACPRPLDTGRDVERAVPPTWQQTVRFYTPGTRAWLCVCVHVLHWIGQDALHIASPSACLCARRLVVVIAPLRCAALAPDGGLRGAGGRSSFADVQLVVDHLTVFPTWT